MNASEQITKYIYGLGDWRGRLLVQLRNVINQAAPGAMEDWKWGTPVWAQNGNILAIDLRNGDPVNEAALIDMGRAAVALNSGERKAKTPTGKNKQ